jgi:hypothetical protein
MHRSLLLAFVAIFAAASVALAATGGKAPRATLVQAVDQTRHASTLRYEMDIAVARRHYPAVKLHVKGTRGTGSLFVHVRELATVLSDGTAVPGPQQSALLDGPFLYEGAPNGVAVYGKVRWLRVPVARLGAASKAVTAMHNLSPAPLLRLLGEYSHAGTHAPHGLFRGKLAWDDRIVSSALSGMTGGIQFRDVHFSAQVGKDGFVHTVRVGGRTADGSRTLTIAARLYAFGEPVRVSPPPEGTFIDEKLLNLAE